MVYDKEVYEFDYFVVATHEDKTSQTLARYSSRKEAETRCEFYRNVYRKEGITTSFFNVQARFAEVYA